MKFSTNINIRDRQILAINKIIAAEGFQAITHHENGKTVLGLYKLPASAEDIPEFRKDLIRGDNKTVCTFIEGMHTALNLIEKATF